MYLGCQKIPSTRHVILKIHFHIVIEDNEVKIVYYLSLRVVTFEIIGEAFSGSFIFRDLQYFFEISALARLNFNIC